MFQEGLHVQRSVRESRSFRCGDVSVFWSVSVSKRNVLVFIDALYDGWIADLTGSFCVFVELHGARHHEAPVLTETPKHPQNSAGEGFCPLYLIMLICTLPSDWFALSCWEYLGTV